jgi:hypothetical protein
MAAIDAGFYSTMAMVSPGFTLLPSATMIF